MDHRAVIRMVSGTLGYPEHPRSAQEWIPEVISALGSSE
jgi:hypothetical protein